MKDKFYVYEFIRLDSGEPFYVGKGCGDRWYKLKRGKNQNFNAIVKNIEVAVILLEENLSNELALEYEIYYINKYIDDGYPLVNFTNGGENPPILKGCHNGNYGNKWTQEQKKNLSDKKKEMYRSGQLVSPWKGKKASEETRKKISDNHRDCKGVNNPSAKRVKCLTTGKIFETMKEAGKYYCVDWTNISNNCRGAQLSAGKLKDGTKLVWIKI